MTTNELADYINKNVTSMIQIPDKNGCFVNKPPKSYHARQEKTAYGVKYWLSTSRNQYSKLLIFKSIKQTFQDLNYSTKSK